MDAQIALVAGKSLAGSSAPNAAAPARFTSTRRARGLLKRNITTFRKTAGNVPPAASAAGREPWNTNTSMITNSCGLMQKIKQQAGAHRASAVAPSLLWLG